MPAVADLQQKLDQKRNAIEADREQRRGEYIDRYRQLVATVADDGNPDPDAVVEVLDALGKNTNDLQKDAETLLQRREWASQLEGEAEATERIQTLNDTIVDLRRKRAEQCRKIDAQIANAAQEQAAAYDTTQRCATARNKLRSSAWWWLKEQEEEIEKVRRMEGPQGQSLRLTIHDQKKQAMATEGLLARGEAYSAEKGGVYVSEPNKKFYREKLKRQRADIKDMEKRLAERQRESDKLSAALAEIDAEKLKP